MHLPHHANAFDNVSISLICTLSIAGGSVHMRIRLMRPRFALAPDEHVTHAKIAVCTDWVFR